MGLIDKLKGKDEPEPEEAQPEGKKDDGEKSEHEIEQEKGRAEMKKLEDADEVPSDPKDWPGGKAKYITFGTEEDEAYGDGVSAKLGPAEVAHQEDGGVTVGGEEVDDPSKYKGEQVEGAAIDVADHGSDTKQDPGKEG